MKRWKITYVDGGTLKVAQVYGELWGVLEACTRNGISHHFITSIEIIVDVRDIL